MSVTAPQHLEKQPSENFIFSMAFANVLGASETIDSITSVTSELRGGGSSDLTIASETIDGTNITIRISGGSNGSTYRIEIIIATSQSNTFEGDGILKVLDK